MSNVPRHPAGGATVKYTHQSAFNEIVGMTHVGLSHYFVAHWLPKISPAGLKILIQLRAMGYYDPKTQTKRGDIDIEQAELAELIGVSKKTVQRAFTEDEVLPQYVQRVFQVKRDKFGRIVKEHYIYVVVMDDVLTPEDKQRYEILLKGPDKVKGPDKECHSNCDPNNDPAGSPKGQNVASDKAELPPKRQNDASGGQNVAPKRHSVPNDGQNVASYNGILTLLTKDNTSPTADAAPEFSASLFPAPDKDILDRLPPEQWAALEAEARERVIAKNGDPVRRLAREGKAWTSVRPMMRKLLEDRKS